MAIKIPVDVWRRVTDKMSTMRLLSIADLETVAEALGIPVFCPQSGPDGAGDFEFCIVEGIMLFAMKKKGE